MATKLEFGKSYHIFNRGNNGADIFFEERNYDYFLKLYQKYITPIADTFAYCLLPNHFHFVLKIKKRSTLTDGSEKGLYQIDLSREFSNFFNSYSKSINKTYNRTGSLFERAFERVEVTSDRYFYQLILYVHLNPQSHSLVKNFQEYSYSSYNILLADQPTFLNKESVVDLFGSWEKFKNAHVLYKEDLQLVQFVGNDKFKTLL